MNSVPVCDLDLAVLPIEDQAFAAAPNPELDRARAQHPWLARFSHGYVVHSYQAIRDLLPRDDKVHIAMDAVVNIMGAQDFPWGGFMRDMMIAMRGADHRDQSVRHLAFGRGAHQCLGMHLARLQIEEGLHLIAQRIKHPELAGKVTWRRFPGVWGIESLPIRFTPASAKQPASTTVGA